MLLQNVSRPRVGRTARGATPEDRLLACVHKTPACWEWTGFMQATKPGVMMVDGRNVAVHVLAYRLWVGPAPKGMPIERTCGNLRCVRPDHLRLCDTAGRLWSRIQRGDDCWLWQGPRQNHGYGTLRHEGRDQLAHRVVWELTNGPIPDGLHVLHRCDIPACCNPAHLWLGTHQENMADMIAKGRQGSTNHPERMARGERNNKAKLTERAVLDIRARYQTGMAGVLAEEYGVTKTLICMVVNRKIWKHVADPVVDERTLDSELNVQSGAA